MQSETGLRIVHCFRSPVGGIFRHVRDLARAQSDLGHKVGIVCDASTGGPLEDRLFEEAAPYLELGVRRFAMRRAIMPSDIAALARTYRHIRDLQPNVLHAHGAKGGAYARIIGSLLRVSGNRVARLYCPHGGVIHYDDAAIKGKLLFRLERLLEHMTDHLVFVSGYERDGYEEKVGMPQCPSSLVYNGLSPADFEPVEANEDAADFLYIGMMRDLKGPDVFLDALHGASRLAGRPLTALFVGDGPDKARYESQIRALGLAGQVRVCPAMPARDAFAQGRTVVVPSRAESMPYLVLEAIAACRPIIATNVGGIPEILSDDIDALVPPDDAGALARAMARSIDSADPPARLAERQRKAREKFSAETMASQIDRIYRSCLTTR